MCHRKDCYVSPYGPVKNVVIVMSVPGHPHLQKTIVVMASLRHQREHVSS
jgi:hypothetical protein